MEKGKPFWKTKSFEAFTKEEWESLCDRCGICCLEKLEDADTGEIFYTNTPCIYYNVDACLCSVYPERFDKKGICFELTPGNLDSVCWLPETCAYRLVREGRDLFWWHHLISGSIDTVHSAGMSVRGFGI